MGKTFSSGGFVNNPSFNAGWQRLKTRSNILIKSLGDFNNDLSSLFNDRVDVKIRRKIEQLRKKNDNAAADEMEQRLNGLLQFVQQSVKLTTELISFLEGIGESANPGDMKNFEGEGEPKSNVEVLQTYRDQSTMKKADELNKIIKKNENSTTFKKDEYSTKFWDEFNKWADKKFPGTKATPLENLTTGSSSTTGQKFDEN